MYDVREVADRMFGALNDHDLGALARCFDPYAVYIASGGMAEGREQIVSFFEYLFSAFPDLRFRIVAKVVADDLAITEWTLTATHKGDFLMPDGQTIPATGRHITLRGCSVSEVENGLIVNHRAYFNALDEYAQLGVHLVSEAGS